MSNKIPAVYQTLYDETVKQEFQDEMRLKGTVRLRNNVVGDKIEFRHFGKGVAKPRGPLASDVPVMGNDYNKTTATMSDWIAKDYTDIFSKPKVNFDELQEQMLSSAMATGRRLDQIIIDALDAAVVPSAADIAVNAESLTFAKVQTAKRILTKQSARGDLYFVISADEEAALLAEAKVTDGDFITNKPLPEGTLDGQKWYGFNWIVLGDRDEGGLPVASTTRTCFAYKGGLKGCIGLGIGIDMTTSADWVAHKASWLAGTNFSAAATTIGDPAAITGLIKVDTLVTA